MNIQAIIEILIQPLCSFCEQRFDLCSLFALNAPHDCSRNRTSCLIDNQQRPVILHADLYRARIVC